MARRPWRHRRGLVKAHCQDRELLEAVVVLHLVEDPSLLLNSLCLAAIIEPGDLQASASAKMAIRQAQLQGLGQRFAQSVPRAALRQVNGQSATEFKQGIIEAHDKDPELLEAVDVLHLTKDPASLTASASLSALSLTDFQAPTNAKR